MGLLVRFLNHKQVVILGKQYKAGTVFCLKMDTFQSPFSTTTTTLHSFNDLFPGQPG